MKIIAGSYAGTRLVTPEGLKTRPTLARVRKSLLQILEPHLLGARVLDLFAGAGTLGLEALSRGAEHATFVEKAPAAIAALNKNIDKLCAAARVRVVRADALAFLARGDQIENPWDVILLDPPYDQGMAAAALSEIEKRAEICLAPGGLVVVQFGSREADPGTDGKLSLTREKRYGETTVRIYAAQSA